MKCGKKCFVNTENPKRKILLRNTWEPMLLLSPKDKYVFLIWLGNREPNVQINISLKKCMYVILSIFNGNLNLRTKVNLARISC